MNDLGFWSEQWVTDYGRTTCWGMWDSLQIVRTLQVIIDNAKKKTLKGKPVMALVYAQFW